ncbi:MAG TPA: hypothetical protein VNH83_25785, partial [Bryobacteraceae bacterium]|nr:hypothetical protein [Bryobacteraceae bacterium]
ITRVRFLRSRCYLAAMFPDVARKSFARGLPSFVGCARFWLAFSANGCFDFFFQVGKKALALWAAWALGLIHSGLSVAGSACQI